MRFWKSQFDFWQRWSSLRSKLRDDPDLLGKAALVLFVTGAVMIVVGLALG